MTNRLRLSWNGSPVGWDTAWIGAAVQCDYNYRGVPTAYSPDFTWVNAVPDRSHYDYAPQPTAERVVLKYTKPAVHMDVSTPMFKTQKLLGSRALVTDSWSRHQVSTLPLLYGMGQYAHRDGYNVLYGDWSAKWYGDPQQRIMWWPNPVNYQWSWPGHGVYTNPIWGEADMARFFSLAVSTVTRIAQESDPAFFYNDNDADGATVTIWNLFDQAAGVDVP